MKDKNLTWGEFEQRLNKIFDEIQSLIKDTNQNKKKEERSKYKKNL